MKTNIKDVCLEVKWAVKDRVSSNKASLLDSKLRFTNTFAQGVRSRISLSDLVVSRFPARVCVSYFSLNTKRNALLDVPSNIFNYCWWNHKPEIAMSSILDITVSYLDHRLLITGNYIRRPAPSPTPKAHQIASREQPIIFLKSS